MSKGIFFDLDGTLADNLDLMFVVYKQFLERFGRHATQEEFKSLNGPPLPEIIGLLMKRHSLAGPEEEHCRSPAALPPARQENVFS